MDTLQRYRARLGASVSGLFSHGEMPLQRTADHPGDAGLCGPGSVSWKAIGDVSVFVGAIRALLIQAAHPEAVAGVDDHSRYRDDPDGAPEPDRVLRDVGDVRGHARSRGGGGHASGPPTKASAAPRTAGLDYDASNAGAGRVGAQHPDRVVPDVSYREFGLGLTETEADRFVVEQSQVGAMLGAAPLPQTAAELHTWVRTHPALAPSPGMRSAVDFLRRPPLPARQRLGYAVLIRGAISTMPPELTGVLGLKARPGARLTTTTSC